MPALCFHVYTVVVVCSLYTKVYSLIFDSGSVPRRVIFSPRKTSPEVINPWTLMQEIQGGAGAWEAPQRIPASARYHKFNKDALSVPGVA